MVSFNVYRSTASGAYVEGVCLSTDEKPVVGIANGSILFAVDTTSGETTRYMYDQNSMSWIEAACPCGGGGSGGSGGGGGSGGEGPLIVNIVDKDPSTQTKGPLRGGGSGSGGKWLDTNSATIFNALLSRGVIVHRHLSGDDEVSLGDSYFQVSSWHKVESEGLFGFVVDGSHYEGSDTGYPAKAGV